MNTGQVQSLQKKLLLLLFSTVLLFAEPGYPELFSSLGTPLYQADESFSKLPEERKYSLAVDKYHQKQIETLELSKTADKKAYLKRLRVLAKEHDKIVALIRRDILDSIRDNKYQEFIALNNIGMDTLYRQDSFKSRVYDYYLKNTDKGRSPYLEEKIGSEKKYQKLYGVDITTKEYTSAQGPTHYKRQEKVVLLSRPGCGYCLKAKSFMRSQGISFREYDIYTSNKGKALYKRYQGSGVPLIIIGKEVIRGYSPEGIIRALE